MKASVKVLPSIWTVMRVLDGPMGRDWRVETEGWVRSRTAAMTVLFGLERYVASSPLPSPVSGWF